MQLSLDFCRNLTLVEAHDFPMTNFCAFCTTELTSSDAKELKTLIQNEWKVQPSCGQPVCLSLNPKANYNNGWTANEKTSRKRRQSAANQQPAAKRRKKSSKPKRHKKSTGSNRKS